MSRYDAGGRRLPNVEVKAASDGAGRGDAVEEAVPGRGSTTKGSVMMYYRKECLRRLFGCGRSEVYKGLSFIAALPANWD